MEILQKRQKTGQLIWYQITREIKYELRDTHNIQ